MKLHNAPTVVRAATVCKSNVQGNHHMLFGKLDAAVAWRQGRLVGFAHLQSDDRRMHVFSDPARSGRYRQRRRNSIQQIRYAHR